MASNYCWSLFLIGIKDLSIRRALLKPQSHPIKSSNTIKSKFKIKNEVTNFNINGVRHERVRLNPVE